MESKSGRICAFCSREIEPDAPPEHVLPKWLAKFRPKYGRFLEIREPEYHDGIEYPSPIPSFRTKKFELTADTVCAECNHHWMSDLETWCSPLLTPMILGEPQGFTVEQQTLVSQWIVKTALTWDQSRKPEHRTFPIALCQALWKHRLPPAGTMIRLGSYHDHGDEFVRMMSHALVLPGVSPDDISTSGYKALRTTIRIGHLVMEVVIADDPSGVLGIGGGDAENVLLAIWPSVDALAWPPRHDFDQAALDSFTEPRSEEDPKPAAP